MDLDAWQLLAGLTIVIVVFWVGIEVADAPGSAILLLIALAFGAAGILLGRYLAKQKM